MIELDGLTKRFGARTVVDSLSFQVTRGEVLGFLGPNGAGKSTTMKMLTGFLKPSAGRALIAGIDVEKDPIAAKTRLGYLPEGAPAWPDMTPRGFLDFCASIRGLSGADARKAVDHAVSRTTLADVLDQPIDTLSKGFKRRVGLAQTLLHDPEVLILDEPTDGLDPNQKHEVRRLIADISADKAIIISTHILEEVEAICSRAIVIARGRIVADATPSALEAKTAGHNRMAITVAGDAERARKALEAIPEVARVDIAGARILVTPQGGAAIGTQVAAALVSAGVTFEEIRREHGRLDEVFRALTRGEEQVYA